MTSVKFLSSNSEEIIVADLLTRLYGPISLHIAASDEAMTANPKSFADTSNWCAVALSSTSQRNTAADSETAKFSQIVRRHIPLLHCDLCQC